MFLEGLVGIHDISLSLSLVKLESSCSYSSESFGLTLFLIERRIARALPKAMTGFLFFNLNPEGDWH